MLKAEQQNTRSFLGKVKAYDDLEIKAEFDYKTLSDTSAKLFSNLKIGKE